MDLTVKKHCTLVVTLSAVGVELTTVTDPSNKVLTCSASSNIITCLAKTSGTYTVKYAGSDVLRPVTQTAVV